MKNNYPEQTVGMFDRDRIRWSIDKELEQYMTEGIQGNTGLGLLTLEATADVNSNEALKPDDSSFTPGKHRAEKWMGALSLEINFSPLRLVKAPWIFYFSWESLTFNNHIMKFNRAGSRKDWLFTVKSWISHLLAIQISEIFLFFEYFMVCKINNAITSKACWRIKWDHRPKTLRTMPDSEQTFHNMQ